MPQESCNNEGIQMPKRPPLAFLALVKSYAYNREIARLLGGRHVAQSPVKGKKPTTAAPPLLLCAPLAPPPETTDIIGWQSPPFLRFLSSYIA